MAQPVQIVGRTGDVIAEVDANGAILTSTQGGVASGATDSGNPMKVGGKYNATPPTLTDGQRGDLQLDAKASAKVALTTTAGVVIALGVTDTTADGRSPATTALNAGSFNYQSNGVNWDRVRGNVDATVFATAARTATPTPYDGVNYNGRGLHLVIDCTAITSSPSVVFTIQAKDAISGKFYTILASAAIVAAGTTILRVYPGLTAAANLVASDILPRSWRVIATHGNSDSITYTVGASIIL